MALVHSLWTAPMLNNERGQASRTQIESTVWCFASSVAYAKRLGENIHLYVDDYGRELLDFLPYNKINELKVDPKTPTYFWAAGKFYALMKMELGDVHIDGDVFLKTPEIMEVIRNGLYQSDLIVQSIENSWIHENEYYIKCLDIIKEYNIQLPNNYPDYHPAFNCGLVGFNNQEFKDKYIANYLDSIKAISNNDDAANKIINSKDIWMDLLIEQQHLFSMAEKYDYTVCNLLGEGDSVYINAEILGYQHLLGPDKWEQLDKIKKQLYLLNREIYNAVVAHLNQILL